MEWTTDNYIIPEWAVCPLEYGDMSGLTDEEIMAIEQFTGQLPDGGCFSYEEEPFFTHYGSDIMSHLGQTVLAAEYTYPNN